MYVQYCVNQKVFKETPEPQLRKRVIGGVFDLEFKIATGIIHTIFKFLGQKNKVDDYLKSI